jgi:hypothetical protein
MSRSIKHKHQRILQASIVVSILLHVAELHFLQRQALWFSTPTQVQTEESTWSAGMERQARTQILKEAFASNITSKQNQKEAEPIAHPISKSQEASSIQTTQNGSSIPPFDLSSTTAASYKPPSIEHFFSIPKIGVISIEPHCEPTLAKAQALPPPNSLHIPSTPNLTNSSIALYPVAVKSSQTMPKLPSLADLHTIPYSAFFDTELVFYEVEENTYFFALTLIPKPTLKLTPFRQNYCFLIDRSNSVQKERLLATKNAVQKAIEELDPQDRFNIFVFDQKLDKLSSTPLSVSPESLSKARKFLDAIELGSFFSQTNMYKPLSLTLPSKEVADELYTTILLTDGNEFTKSHEAYQICNQWTHLNKGKTSLYVLSLSTDPQLHTLQMATHLNRGSLITSTTNKGIKRKLLKLLKMLHSPVARNLSCRAISRSSSSSVEILPHPEQSAHLYLYEPYTILGQTHSLDDFVLFVQGKLNGKWLHIKKQISFLNAKKGDASLAGKWAEQKALALYQQYLENQNPQLLHKANELLTQNDLPSLE